LVTPLDSITSAATAVLVLADRAKPAYRIAGNKTSAARMAALVMKPLRATVVTGITSSSR
jgi:hypothetical protein